jgi:hypothetical protein
MTDGTTYIIVTGMKNRIVMRVMIPHRIQKWKAGFERGNIIVSLVSRSLFYSHTALCTSSPLLICLLLYP